MWWVGYAVSLKLVILIWDIYTIGVLYYIFFFIEIIAITVLPIPNKKKYLILILKKNDQHIIKIVTLAMFIRSSLSTVYLPSIVTLIYIRVVDKYVQDR